MPPDRKSRSFRAGKTLTLTIGVAMTAKIKLPKPVLGVTFHDGIEIIAKRPDHHRPPPPPR